ncbi:MAG: alpha/beta fold hydrolase [Xanthobacteraceae bacterium]
MTGAPRRHWLGDKGRRMALDLHNLDLHELESGRRIAVVAHGRNGAPDQLQMIPIIAACRSIGLGVVAPHCRNSNANCSDGTSQTFTMEGAVADLREVLDWVGTEGFAPPTLVAGHSMGGYAALRLAAERSEVGAVLAVSPVTSGTRLLAAHRAHGSLDMLDREVPEARAEWPLHDISGLAAKITQPAALLVGSLDHLTQVPDVAALRAQLPNVVFWRVLEDEPHCPVGTAYPVELSAAMKCLGLRQQPS